MNSFQSLTKFTSVTLILVQIVVLILKYMGVDIFGIDFANLSTLWTFAPILAFAFLKWGYWISGALYNLFVVILNIALIFAIIYALYWIFF